jgi:hypothetical protein
MKYALLLVAALLLSVSAVAQHKHSERGPNGGQMVDVAGVDAELLISGTTLTINIFDESNKPIPTKGFAASALVVAGSDQETVALAPSGQNALTGTAKKPVASGAAVTVMLKTAAGKSGQARYKN